MKQLYNIRLNLYLKNSLICINLVNLSIIFVNITNTATNLKVSKLHFTFF